MIKKPGCVDEMPLIQGIALGGTYAEEETRAKDGTKVITVRDRTQAYLGKKVNARGIAWDVVAEKDSRLLTELDISRVEKILLSTSAKSVVIACGTYRLRKLGLRLKGNKKIRAKGITGVIFGSFTPLMEKMDEYGPADAAFNLGGAIVTAQALPPGWYVCMHGRIHSPERVRKHTDDGVFDVLTPAEADDFTDDDPWYVEPTGPQDLVAQLQGRLDQQEVLLRLQQLSQQQLLLLAQQLWFRQLEITEGKSRSSPGDPQRLMLELDSSPNSSSKPQG